MIGGVARHGRTRRDTRALQHHLLKDPGARVEMLDCLAQDLPSALRTMELMRDGTAADAAFLHIHLSPSTDLSEDQLRRVAEIVREHLGVADHPAALVFHQKDRRGGQGGLHGHLVLGRVGPDGVAMASSFEKIRLETAMRIAEFELGEAPTLGRHHASGVRWLRANGRADVADWLEAAHGPEPEKPTSAASPSKRQKLARKGVELSDAAERVRDAWSRSDGGVAFAAALRTEGFDVAPGQKPGVFVVSSGGVEIGALDRIVKLKRRDVAARMEGFENDRAAPEEALTSRGDLSTGPSGEPGGAEAGALAPAPRDAGGRGVADRAASGNPGSGAPWPEADVAADRGPARQDRRPVDQARLTLALRGFRSTPTIRAELALLRLRRSRPFVLARQLLRLDFGRLRELAFPTPPAPPEPPAAASKLFDRKTMADRIRLAASRRLDDDFDVPHLPDENLGDDEPESVMGFC